MAAPAAATRYKQVIAVKKPSADEPIAFLVEHADGSRVLVSNAALRQVAPPVLLDFYEARGAPTAAAPAAALADAADFAARIAEGEYPG